MPRARRRCGTRGCDAAYPCPVHTRAPWSTSSRRLTLPADWPRIRARILERDPVCRLGYPGRWMTAAGYVSCAVVSAEVDHIDSPTDHEPSNLRGVCVPCHRRRTQAQSAAARTRRRP
jgi:5-methylcytosine-specific restriction protein A